LKKKSGAEARRPAIIVYFVLPPAIEVARDNSCLDKGYVFLYLLIIVCISSIVIFLPFFRERLFYYIGNYAPDFGG
jgi:hypothetical protein